MKAQIEGNLYLESDSMQFIIKDYTGAVNVDKKTGKETETYNTLGYFSSIESACKFLIKMKLMQSSAANLQELLQDFNRINQWVRSLFQSESA